MLTASLQGGGQLGILPWPFDERPTTSQTLDAMDEVFQYVRQVDREIHAGCKSQNTTFGPFIIPVPSDCPIETAALRSSWNVFANEVYEWYLQNDGFWSRFVDTTSLYDEAQAYLARTTAFREDAKKFGIQTFGQPPKPKPRAKTGDMFTNALGDMLTFAKWGAAIYIAFKIGPPIVEWGQNYLANRASGEADHGSRAAFRPEVKKRRRNY